MIDYIFLMFLRRKRFKIIYQLLLLFLTEKSLMTRHNASRICCCWHDEDVNVPTTFHKICFSVNLLQGILLICRKQHISSHVHYLITIPYLTKFTQTDAFQMQNSLLVIHLSILHSLNCETKQNSKKKC